MRYLLAVLALSFSLSAFAAGPNDGIYAVTAGPAAVIDNGYVTVHQNGEVVIVIDMDLTDYTFDVYQGIRVGDAVELGLVASQYNGGIGLLLEFQSTVNATATLTSCSPGEGTVCNAEPGAVLTLVRVF